MGIAALPVNQRGSNPLSRAVHRVDQATSRPATAFVVAVLVVMFGIALAIAGFPQTWETAFAPRARQ